MRRLLLTLALPVLMLAAARPLAAQVRAEPAPTIAEAETVFEQGIRAFDEGDYGMAYRRLRLVYEQHPLHRRTTAAYLMAGKALYRSGEARQAAGVLRALVERYPESRYAPEASALLARIGGGEAAAPRRLVNVGVVLPLHTGLLAQALFNGIRLAVEDFNAEDGGRAAVRMVFRDSGRDGKNAEAAVRELAAERPAVILGPLFSEEARLAGAAAERAGIVLVAPLATDEAVSAGRKLVFQANPSPQAHGRLMGRYAREALQLKRFGILAERGNSGSEGFAEGFAEGVRDAGGEVVFTERVAGSALGNPAAALSEERAADLDALYTPLAGENAQRLAGGVVRVLRSRGADVRLLGNQLWHDFEDPEAASALGLTYTDDFAPGADAPRYRAFLRRYEELAGRAPEGDELRLAVAGYDATGYVLGYAARDARLPLQELLRRAEPYQGIGLRMHFAEGNINHAVYYMAFRRGEAVVLE